jgi:uncharacterized membrane protein YjjB (DUF3815 family)
MSIVPRWDGLELQTDADMGVRLSSFRAARPTGVNMDRVASAMRAVDAVVAGALAPAAAAAAISTASGAPPVPTWLFMVAAAGGAAALSLIFGVEHPSAVALIAASAALGAVLRRAIAWYSANTLLQPFCAALVAGLIGAVAVRFSLSSSLRLVAVCPCMILVPGPHVLNGAMDLVQARINLGASRLMYAGVVVLMISVGLLLGLAVMGVSLPVDPPGRPVPLWLDMIAAGATVAAYSVFFSTPLRMLPWPIAIGTIAHGLRSVVLSMLGASVATGALVACLVVGLVLAPVARRYHMPFAAVSFASVVWMLPGIYVFRMASGLEQLADGSTAPLALLSGTISDGITAILIMLAMTAGLMVPRLAIAGFDNARIPSAAATVRR